MLWTNSYLNIACLVILLQYIADGFTRKFRSRKHVHLLFFSCCCVAARGELFLKENCNNKDAFTINHRLVSNSAA